MPKEQEHREDITPPGIIKQKQYYKCKGWIKVYEQQQVIYQKKFQTRKQLKEIMEDYQGLEMSIMIDDNEIDLITKY